MPGQELQDNIKKSFWHGLKCLTALFFVEKRYYIIVDEAIGNATGDVDIHFQLAPGDAIFDYKNFSVTTDFEKGKIKQIGYSL